MVAQTSLMNKGDESVFVFTPVDVAVENDSPTERMGGGTFGVRENGLRSFSERKKRN